MNADLPDPATLAADEITANDVAVSIGSAAIIDDICLHARSGEVVGICGPNGSGKSTLLRTIYGVLRPTGGAVWLAGDDIARLPPKERARRISVVLQERATEFDYTVRQMVGMGRDPHKGMFDRDDEDDRRLVDDAMARVGLSDLAERSFATLSGGERQRALVARALAQSTPVVVLDEPTNHLDIRYQLEVMEIVSTLGRTVVAALHDLNLALTHCDRLYVLSEGRVVTSGPPADVLAPPLIRSVFAVDTDLVVHEPTGTRHLVFLGPTRRSGTTTPDPPHTPMEEDT